MNEWKCQVEIEHMTDGQVEVRLFDCPKNGKYLSWKIPLLEAQDLSSWWEEEAHPKTLRLPLIDSIYRSIQISMYSPTLVLIKGFDAYGTPKIVGFSLPTEVVEALVNYFAAQRESNRSSTTTHEDERGLETCTALEAATPK